MTISVPVCAGYSRAIRAPDKLGIAQVPYGLHRWLPVQTVGNLRVRRLLRARFGAPWIGAAGRAGCYAARVGALPPS